MVKLNVPNTTYQCECCGEEEFLPVKYEIISPDGEQTTVMCRDCGPRERARLHTEDCKHEERIR